MLFTTVAVIVVLAVIFTFWHVGKKPAIHRKITEDELGALLLTLLNQGYQGGALFIRGRDKVPFLQVMKYIGRERTGLQLDFPRADWARDVLPDVELLLCDFDAKQTGGWTERGNDMQFLTVDFGTDVNLAKRCVQALAEKALRIDLVRDGRAHFENVSPLPAPRSNVL
jgi:hypothetical protein